MGLEENSLKDKLKESKEEIEKLETRYRLITENTDDLISILDDKFKIEYINKEAHKKIVGFDWDESVGFDGLRFIHPDDLEKMLKTGRNDWEKGEARFEIRSKRKDGRYVWFNIKCKRFMDTNGKTKFLTVSRNITDRKLAEQKFAKSKEKYKEILDFLPDIIYELDTNFNITYTNRAGFKKFGYTQKNIHNGLNISNLVPSNELERAIRNGKNLLNKIPQKPQDYEMIKKDGTTFWARIHAKPIIKGEKVVGIRGIIRDISEQKWFEDMVIESEEKFRRIFHSIPDLFFIVSEDSTVLDYSGRKQDFFISPEELLGKKMRNMLPPELGKRTLDLVKKVIKTQQPQILEYTLPLKDKDEYFEARILYLAEDRVAIFIRNITKRKLAEERLSRKNDLLNGINKVFQVAMVCKTDENLAKTCLEVAQEVTESYFGFIAEIAREKHIDFLEINAPGWKIFKSSRSKGAEMIKYMKEQGFLRRILKTKRSFKISEPLKDPHTSDLPDTHPPLKSFLCVPLIQLDSVVGMIGLANKKLGYDLTDQRAIESLAVAFSEALMRKRAEREVIEHREHLEEMVHESLTELKISQKELQKKTIEQKKVGKVLEASEEKFRETLDLLPDIVYEVDPDLNLIYANQALYKTFGYSQEDFDQGVKTAQLLSPKVLERAMRNFRKLLNGLRVEPQDYILRKKDGSEFWGRVHSKPIYKEGEIIGVRGVISDITERKKIEDRLKESEQRIRNFFENNPDGILIADTETKKFTFGNKKISEMLGYTLKEITALTVNDIHPKDEVKYVIEQFDKLARGEILLAKDIPVKRKDGTIFYADINTASIMLNGKQHLVGGFRDITERKVLEDQLRNISNNLTKKVEEKTQELREAQKQLISKEKLAVVGKFAGGISDKLRSPFEIINNTLFNLKLKLKDAGGDVRRNLNIIQQATNRACDLILGLPEYDQVKVPMLLESNVNDIILESLKEINIPEDISVEKKLEPNLPKIDLDPNQIKQAFLNVIINAVQAMPNGGRLTISSGLTNNCVTVIIKDTGEGIADVNLHRVFEPLFSTKADAIGMGLPIVKDIIEKHEGEIKLFSKLGEGTKIKIKLPLSQK